MFLNVKIVFYKSIYKLWNYAKNTNFFSLLHRKSITMVYNIIFGKILCETKLQGNFIQNLNLILYFLKCIWLRIIKSELYDYCI